MGSPATIDSVTLSDDTDFVDLAKRSVLGQVGGGLPSDSSPLDWLWRAFPLIQQTAYADQFSEGIAACLTDADPVVRAGSLTFFGQFPAAKGARRVLELARGDRSRFDGIPDPTSPGYDLGWLLSRAIGALASVNEEEALEVARADALTPGKAGPVMAALTSADPLWVASHAEEIVKGTPSAAITILYNLQESAVVNVGDVGERIAPFAAMDPKFRARLETMIDDAPTKARIVAAMGSAKPQS